MRLIYLALPLALAACGQQADEPAPEASETAIPVEPDGGIGDGAGPPAAAPSPAHTVGIPEMGIPVAVQGSWGLTPADCTSSRGDAKGLLRVSPTTLTFYESVARLGTIKNRSDTSITADFGFAGEGMEWTRTVSLTVSGDTLTRTERGGDEPGTGGPFTYTKCAA